MNITASLPALCLALLTGCASTSPTHSADTTFKTVFPHIRINTAQHIVEIDGIVCIDAADPNQPAAVPLECFIITPVSGKEHESLVLTQASAKEIHAALLMAGFEPGAPGSFDWDAATRTLNPIPPRGQLLTISVASDDHDFVNIGNWAMHMNGAALVPDHHSAATWHFAGSRFTKTKGGEIYEAQMTGIIAGLCTFGGEVLAWPDTISADSTMQEPDFIADKSKVPSFKTAVRVRISTNQGAPSR